MKLLMSGNSKSLAAELGFKPNPEDSQVCAHNTAFNCLFLVRTILLQRQFYTPGSQSPPLQGQLRTPPSPREHGMLLWGAQRSLLGSRWGTGPQQLLGCNLLPCTGQTFKTLRLLQPSGSLNDTLPPQGPTLITEVNIRERFCG